MDIIGVTLTKIVDQAAYQLQRVAHTWSKQWKGGKGYKCRINTMRRDYGCITG